MSDIDRYGVLLAAHGERGGGADNASVERLAAELGRRGLAADIAFGFVKGAPTIAQAVKALTTPRIIVYPLFFSDGYFTKIRLPQLLAEAGLPDAKRSVTILPPLGLDPGLAALVAANAARTMRNNGYAERQTGVVLLAHGSTKDTASRRATDGLAERLRALQRFSAVRSAFLEEEPALESAIERMPGPTVVIGLFAGQGLHGAEDVPRLIAGLRRPDVAFAGNVGTWDIADAVAEAVRRVDCARSSCASRAPSSC